MSAHDRHTAFNVLAGIFWSIALTLGIFGSISGEIRVLFWGGFLALVACIVTNHIITQQSFIKHRRRVEALTDGVIAVVEQRSDVSRLH